MMISRKFKIIVKHLHDENYELAKREFISKAVSMSKKYKVK